MARAKPVEKVHQTYGSQFDQLCLIASRFWPRNTLRDNEDVIFVDLLMQDVRVALRNLTVANAIRRVHPARIVALVGPDPDWDDTIWQYYDAERLSALATGYGAVEVLNLADLVDEAVAGSNSFELLGETVTLPQESGIDPKLYDDILDATAVRVIRVPEITDAARQNPVYQRVVERSAHYARIYEALFNTFKTAAFITSHIDYSQWGLAVDAGMRAEVPVIHVQSTGTLKAYALFPDQIKGEGTYRMQMTRLIAEYFEECIWKHRDVLRRSAELTTWRSKVNLGRPSWWRGGGSVSQLEFRTSAERDSVREYACRRFGWDPAKPIIAVFDHAVSDAVHSNFETFDNLADWLRQTVEFAARNDQVNWLFIDHPAQAYYDQTEMFESLTQKHSDQAHMAFTPSMNLSKNVIWSLVDLAVTVRGSVSNEYPAYGIPALQAGWSEWSHCGISHRADTQEEYWQELESAMERLNNGESLITSEQIERARLWLWYYRCASDVPSPLVPHWESSQGDRLYMSVNLAMSHVECDGDSAFVSVRRMWHDHEPFLTRADLHRPSAELPDLLGMVAEEHLEQA